MVPALATPSVTYVQDGPERPIGPREPVAEKVKSKDKKPQKPLIRLWGYNSEEDSSDTDSSDTSSDGEEDHDGQISENAKRGADKDGHYEDDAPEGYPGDEADRRDELIERVASLLIFAFVLCLLFYVRVSGRKPY